MIPDYTNLSILIVDDDAPSLLLFKELLTNTNASLYCARNKNEFEQIINSGSLIQIVLLDIKFGVYSGFDLLPVIRNKHPMAKVIAQTAYFYPGENEQLIYKAFDGLIFKPIKTEQLFCLIDSLIGDKINK